MAGELSKKIGQNGEDIVEQFFQEYLGFPNYREGLTIKCFEESHKELRKNSPQTHGIDGLVHYKSLLDEDLLEIGYISVKHSNNPYPTAPRSKFKDHFIDLATGLDCFQYSNIKADIEKSSSRVNRTRVIGVLFWLSNNESSKSSDIIEEIGKSQLESLGIPFDELIVVDNGRLQFLLEVLEYAKLHSNNNYSFVYPDTGLNLKANTNNNFGDIMPMEFFAYEIIPLRYEIDSNIYFHLACRSKFSAEGLSEVISLCKSFNKLQAVEQTIITFPDFNKGNHGEIVSRVKSHFDDQNFTKSINVLSQGVDFRNLKI
jgi:hypothetical protein